jgi:hypothetical protein
MRKLYVILFIVFASFLLAENITDGPYFKIENNKVRLHYILDGKLKTDEFCFPPSGELDIKIPELNGRYKIFKDTPAIPKSEYSGVDKFFSVSDIHGQYKRFIKILVNNHVIDDSLNWSFGTGHLIINGDVFDRGNQVTESLWLIKKLQQQAQLMGGRVHYILGNHEVAILKGDDRYVNSKYISSAEIIGVKHKDLYSNETILGRWLRTRNTCIKINDFYFVHGGISPELLKNGITPLECNEIVRDIFDTSSFPKEYTEIQELILGSLGPFWYRGYFVDGQNYKQLHKDELLAVLKNIKAENIIVGHTTQDFINPFFGNKVIPIDSGIKYGDQGEGLLWKNGVFYRALADGYQEKLD